MASDEIFQQQNFFKKKSAVIVDQQVCACTNFEGMGTIPNPECPIHGQKVKPKNYHR